MRRDIKKLLEEYEKLKVQHKGALYYSDIKQIYELSSGEKFDCIWTAYQVGVAIGYRIKKREEKLKNN